MMEDNVMKKIFLLLFVLSMALQVSSADLLTGKLLLNGEEINAEFMKLSNTEVALGSGHDACISQYSQGRLHIPGTVKIGSTTYTIKRINSMAFRLCSALTFVDIDAGVTYIGNFAFQGCAGLKEVDLPSTLERIGTGAFIDLPLMRLKCEATVPPTWEYNDVFKFHEGGIGDDHAYYIGSTHLTVPSVAEGAYRAALYSNPSIGWTTPDGWERFSGIGDAFFDSYHIYTANDLNALREFCIDREREGERIQRVFLEDDIDMEGYAWTSGIGEFDYEFQGSFYGQGHTISNLNVVANDLSNSGVAAGLFGFYEGELISDLRLRNCRFSHHTNAGSLVGYVKDNYDVRFDSIYVSDCIVESDINVGGLVGNSTVTLSINNCYVNASCGRFDLDGDQANPNASGTLVGKGYKTTIRNCAVPIPSSSETSFGNFVGVIQNSYGNYGNPGYCDVDSCYTYEYKKPLDKYTFGDNIVFSGDEWILWRGDTQYPQVFGYNPENMKGYVLVPYLGIERWAYKHGELPVPECFATEWNPEVNKFIICPEGKGILNGLTPTEEIPMKAWHTDDDRIAFHNYDFIASRLWFNEDINPNVMDRPGELPLGIGTITSTGGVEYARVLQAKDIGPHTYEEPKYAEDSEGNLVETGEYVTITDGREYQPVGYSVYLPYRLRMSPYCKLYQPQTLTTEDDATTIHFRLLNTEYIEPFTPYYIVVEAETFPLSTEAETYFPKISDTNIDLGTYTFKGTNKSVSNYLAQLDNAYILQSDGKWHRVYSDGDSEHVQANIPAFRAYFSKKSGMSSGVNELRMVFGDEDDAIGIKEMLDDDWRDKEIYDLSGRRVANPTKGVYIIGDRKVMYQ